MAAPRKLEEDSKQQFVQIYVFKFAEDATPVAADNWATTKAIEGAGGYAIVRLLVTQELYLVLT